MQLSGKRGKRYNVSRPHYSPWSHYDNLHLFLRVADILIDLLIVELRGHDSVDKLKRFTRFNPEKYKHIDAFQNLCPLWVYLAIHSTSGRTQRC